MSFLSSHRLHWGVHHELSDNFRIQLEQIALEARHLLPSLPSSAHSNNASATPSPLDPVMPQLGASMATPPQPEALGP